MLGLGQFGSVGFNLRTKVWISFFYSEKELINLFFTKGLLLYFEGLKRKGERTKLYIIPKKINLKKKGEKKRGTDFYFIFFFWGLVSFD